MSAFFVDTSAVVKRYLNETGAAWVKSWIELETGNDIIISALTTVEMNSVLMRRERENFITDANRITMLNDFLYHVETEYIAVPLDDHTLEEARNLLIKHPLRALDALQLASAIRANRRFSVPLTFVSADVRLLEAAAAEGLPTDDPNTHA